MPMWDAHVARQRSRSLVSPNFHAGKIDVPAIGGGDEVLATRGWTLLNGGSMRDDAAGQDQAAKLIQMASSDGLDRSVEIVRVDAGVDAAQTTLIGHALKAPSFGPIISSDHQGHVAFLN